MSAKFAENFTSSELFAIELNPSKTVYHLHKKTLAARVPYFAGLLSFKGTEVAENKVCLSSADTAFVAFVEYIYTNNYTDPMNTEVEKTMRLHITVYLLADELCMDDLQKLAAERVAASISKYTLSPAAIPELMDLVELVYSNTPNRYKDPTDMHGASSRDPLRKSVLDLCHSKIDVLKSRPEFYRVVRLHGEFAQDFISKSFPELPQAAGVASTPSVPRAPPATPPVFGGTSPAFGQPPTPFGTRTSSLFGGSR